MMSDHAAARLLSLTRTITITLRLTPDQAAAFGAEQDVPPGFRPDARAAELMDFRDDGLGRVRGDPGGVPAGGCVMIRAEDDAASATAGGPIYIRYGAPPEEWYAAPTAEKEEIPPGHTDPRMKRAAHRAKQKVPYAKRVAKRKRRAVLAKKQRKHMAWCEKVSANRGRGG